MTIQSHPYLHRPKAQAQKANAQVKKSKLEIKGHIHHPDHN